MVSKGPLRGCRGTGTGHEGEAHGGAVLQLVGMGPVLAQWRDVGGGGRDWGSRVDCGRDGVTWIEVWPSLRA